MRSHRADAVIDVVISAWNETNATGRVIEEIPGWRGAPRIAPRSDPATGFEEAADPG